MKRSGLLSIGTFAAAALSIAVAGQMTAAQTPQKTERTKVMVLGVYHFTNPNADHVKTSFPDHLSEKKQKEIAELLDALARFEPTKIVIEDVPENEKVNNNYLEYLKGSYQLTANETNQIGYRLAKRFGHKRIYQADHRIGMDINGVMAAANETKNTTFLNHFQRVISEVQAMQKRHETETVINALIELNEPPMQERTKDVYLQMARVKSGDKFVGADVLTNWYQRNLRIFSNLVEIIEPSDTRILVIFGQGHAPYLRDAIKSSPDMELVEPNDYLKRNPGSITKGK
ncbi:MAG: DUF5694 domain-containing protein [Pyrinomonadaceae bacterium]